MRLQAPLATACHQAPLWHTCVRVRVRACTHVLMYLTTLSLALLLQTFKALGLHEPSAVPGVSKAQLVEDVRQALYASKITSYAQVRGGGERYA